MTCLTSMPLVLQKCRCSTAAVFSQRLRLVPDSDSATHHQGARHRVSGVLPHCFLGVTDTCCSFVKYSNHVLVRADSVPSTPHPTPPPSTTVHSPVQPWNYPVVVSLDHVVEFMYIISVRMPGEGYCR